MVHKPHGDYSGSLAKMKGPVLRHDKRASQCTQIRPPTRIAPNTHLSTPTIFPLPADQRGAPPLTKLLAQNRDVPLQLHESATCYLIDWDTTDTVPLSRMFRLPPKADDTLHPHKWRPTRQQHRLAVFSPTPSKARRSCRHICCEWAGQQFKLLAPAGSSC